MHFSKVVFPEPFGPQIIILFPSGKSREKLLITRLLLYPANRLEIFIPKKQKCYSKKRENCLLGISYKKEKVFVTFD